MRGEERRGAEEKRHKKQHGGKEVSVERTPEVCEREDREGGEKKRERDWREKEDSGRTE